MVAAATTQAREHHCLTCGFDMSRLDMTVLYAKQGAAGRKLRCPICGSNRLAITALERIFFRPGALTWARWGDANAGQPGVISVGKFRLKVQGEIKTLTKEMVCFRAVPTFVSGGARLWPTMPVRPEFIDVLDPVALEEAQRNPAKFGKQVQEGGRSRFQYLLPLRGLSEKEWPTHTCDVLPADPSGAGESEAFRGVSVRLWPNLKRPHSAWKFYVLSVGAANEKGLELFAKGRDFRAHALVPKPQGDGVVRVRELSYGWEPIATEHGAEGASGATQRVLANDTGRPAWVSLAFYPPQGSSGSGDPLGGGLFAIAPGDPTAVPGDSWQVGLDFGTSNTVLAMRFPDGTRRTVQPEKGRARASTTFQVIDGGPHTIFRGIDLWPGGAWSGPYNDLLPSELAATRRWVDIGARGASEISNLKFGEELGIPLRGGHSKMSSENVVNEFKWKRSVARDKPAVGDTDKVQALQARFLEGAVLMTLAARLAEEDIAPRTVNVQYSYPLAFDTEDFESLRHATDQASHRLEQLTGAQVIFNRSELDEAQAAVAQEAADKMFRVYLDLGGGSFEILIEDTWARRNEFGHTGMHPHVFSTSIFFGGSAYLRSLVGNNEVERQGTCLMPDVASYAQLAGLVRSMASGRQLVTSRNVIQEAREQKAVRRARAYFGYIVELIARVLAGMCLEHGRTPDGRIDLTRNRLFTRVETPTRRWILGTLKGPASERRIEFELILLGNGWGFGEIVLDGMATVEQMMAERVRKRLMDLLSETPVAREISDGEISLVIDSNGRSTVHPSLSIEMSYVMPEEGTHRKSRVARGLLESSAGNAGVARRTPERHGVLGWDVWLNDSGRRLPWYRPFGLGGEDDREKLRNEASKERAQQQQQPAAAAQPVANVANPMAMAMAMAPMQPAMPMQPQPAQPPVMQPPMMGMPSPMMGMMPGAMGAMGGMPGMPMMQSFSPLEGAAMSLRQSWPNIAAMAQQSGMDPKNYCERYLWQVATQMGTSMAKTAAGYLAHEQWQRVAQALAMSGLSPEQQQWMLAQQWQMVTATAAQRGESAERALAQMRWDAVLSSLFGAGSYPLPQA
jgi:hypothetical protein